MKLNIKIIYSILIGIVFLFLVGFSSDNLEQYTISYGNTTKTIECITNNDGILLLPLNETISMIGYQTIECGRCGKDEIYNEELKDEKGHLYINWYKDIITYSNDPKVIILDANNEKINGITYTSAMLYQYIGYKVSIDDKNKSIVILKDDTIADDADAQNKADLQVNDKSNEIVYVYDPNCTSCKKITSLLEKMNEETNINLIELDASKDSNQKEIDQYIEKANVPKVLQDIYPMLFIGNQYLFHTEITDENISKILDGGVYEHDIEYSIDTKDSDYGDFIHIENNPILIYFYSTTCASCVKSSEYIKKLNEIYPNITILRYNLYEPENINLLKAYGNEYELDKAIIGEIPAIFIADKALIGDENIILNLDSAIIKYNQNNPTKLLDKNSIDVESNIKNGIAVFGAGLLNGINPCSLSMFLFLFSILMVDKKKLMKIGFSFCFGKFLMFFLLGTIFYKTVSLLDPNIINFLTKDILLVMILLLGILNINDLIRAKSERYEKMVLQLPSWLKGVNHSIMKRATKYQDSKFFILVIVLLGMVLAMGEFMCTGQIYLTSIIALIQGDNRDWLALIYLFLYSFAFIIPLGILTVLIYYGKKIFVLSDKLLKQLPLIKGINFLLFLIFGLYIVLNK